jgi:hypothetical protein
MISTYLRWPAAQAARLGRALLAVLRECNAAQRRMTAIRTAPDRYTARPGTAPDTYAEFLYRTSGLLLHEPSARARARARRPGVLR